jgi:hypothetical protein
MWTPSERRFFRSLKSYQKIQDYLDDLDYNPMDDAASPRYILMTKDAHCLEGGLIAATALEFMGHPPLMISLQAEDDDHHVITVYKEKNGWGSLSKSNTALLRGRDPVYHSIRELVMSYFEFYFNTKGEKALYAYSDPINLKKYNHLEWRTTDENLVDLGKNFNDLPHYELVGLRDLKKLPKAKKLLRDACFLGANADGLYQA